MTTAIDSALRPSEPGSLTGPSGAPTEVAARPAAAAREQLRPRVSCVMPCFNEGAGLAGMLASLREVLEGCADEWEIIVVDDGSTDGTDGELERLAGEPGVSAIQLSRNFGKEAALTAGLQAARGDVVVMLDADRQHPPALIPEFLEQWRRGADIVYAVRESRRDEGVLKRVGARGFYRLMNLGDRFEVPAGAGDFRLMDRAAVDALLALPERNRFMKGLYAWVGFRATAVPYMPLPRAHGETRFSPLRLLRLSIDGLTAFTTWPLRAVSLVGFILAVMAFVYGAYLTLVYFMYGHVVSGWTTIAVSLMLFAGIQLVSLGVVGEYIARIFEEVKHRPLYVVRRRLGQGLEDRTER